MRGRRKKNGTVTDDLLRLFGRVRLVIIGAACPQLQQQKRQRADKRPGLPPSLGPSLASKRRTRHKTHSVFSPPLLLLIFLPTRPPACVTYSSGISAEAVFALRCRFSECVVKTRKKNSRDAGPFIYLFAFAIEHSPSALEGPACCVTMFSEPQCITQRCTLGFPLPFSPFPVVLLHCGFIEAHRGCLFPV